MLRRLSAVLILAGLVLGYRLSPSTGCERMAPMSGAMLLATGPTLPGACGQAMIAAQCPTGPCAALPQVLSGFSETPPAPITIDFAGLFYSWTPPPPEPPPPQA